MAKLGLWVDKLGGWVVKSRRCVAKLGRWMAVREMDGLSEGDGWLS
jgi:hypothetical protein